MVPRFLRRRLSIGVTDALARLRAERAIQRLHRRGVRAALGYVERGDLKLNFGCGKNTKQGWVNVDLCESSDLTIDAREPMPFPDASVTEIYSEHFLEHLEYPREARRFLAEALRVLRPGGAFNVGVPDTAWPMRCALEGGGDWFETVQREKWHPEWCDTPMHSLNYHFRQGGEHKYAYDLQALTRVLEQAGFVDVHERGFDAALDDPARRIGTLYVAARKPG